MESIISYTVIIIFIIITVFVYNVRKNSSRLFLLSKQIFPGIKLSTKIQKEKGKISAVAIEVNNSDEVVISDIKAELITGKREFNYYNHTELFPEIDLPIKLGPEDGIQLKIDFNSFKDLMSNGDLPFRTFRFVVSDSNKKVYKTHEFGFNSKWIIYRPDTGSYN